jgi:hypothetical protein
MFDFPLSKIGSLRIYPLQRQWLFAFSLILALFLKGGEEWLEEEDTDRHVALGGKGDGGRSIKLWLSWPQKDMRHTKG